MSDAVTATSAAWETLAGVTADLQLILDWLPMPELAAAVAHVEAARTLVAEADAILGGGVARHASPEIPQSAGISGSATAGSAPHTAPPV